MVWRLAHARLSGVTMGQDCRVGTYVDFDPGKRENRPGIISIGDYGRIEQGAILWAFGGHIRTERNVFLGQYVVIYGHGGVEIGEETLISMHCCILSSGHTIPEQEKIIRHQPDVLHPTRIGRDVWLGAGVKVLGGVTIGDGCIVGAGAVVTVDLPPYSVAVGVPAKIIRRRE